MSTRILIIDDEPILQVTLSDTLRDEGFETSVAGSVREGLEQLERTGPDLVICDLKLPDGEGLEIVEAVGRMPFRPPVIMLTAFGTIATAVEALRAGASEYLTKPFDENNLLAIVRRHVEIRQLQQRVRELEAVSDSPIGHSPSFRRVLALARAAAETASTVLISGETGTGKDVLARFIHSVSPRRDGPFVAVNCAAIPPALIESELFGRAAGAFTGAGRGGKGKFEAADGGTIFLDEIGEMPLELQPKLLRAIEQQSFERLGSTRTLKVDIRVIAASRRDLELAVREGQFRDDLYYRLRVVPIALPPLRERKDDIALLAEHFVRRIERETGQRLDLGSDVLRCLERHSFPGNIRELENLLRRLAAFSGDRQLTAADLPEEYRHCPESARGDGPEVDLEGTLQETMRAYERRVIAAVLARNEGHRGKTASELGISRKNLWEKLKLHGLLDGKDGSGAGD